ncbi:NUDIX hydrolase [Paenibacillus curdlanolyticus YK9]|uniref:NUDIX hydrolase n=1 Tax=Paenibacillus curdlanolyticus YK9 TaxID=717606 RepID=E0IB78_9BACL|nr:NUDIX domain-containing protein [Paenibacillus curdlanolyticus]EFM10369.1 NUDIX hydrolase [Paenibacillus curdlanolyticus YK9]
MAEEWFDIYDEDMRPLGQATRAQTHALGHWHQTFHCWLTRRQGGDRFVRFQLRQLTKDTNPGHYDITAAGHLAAGETLAHAVRELEEELGIAVPFASLHPLMQWREQAEGEVNGRPFIDRELSHVFGLVCDLPLTSFKLQAEEVSGIYEAKLEAMIDLFEGRLPEIAAAGAELDAEGQLMPTVRSVTAAQFVPRDPRYYIDIFRMLQSLTSS